MQQQIKVFSIIKVTHVFYESAVIQILQLITIKRITCLQSVKSKIINESFHYLTNNATTISMQLSNNFANFLGQF